MTATPKEGGKQKTGPLFRLSCDRSGANFQLPPNAGSCWTASDTYTASGSGVGVAGPSGARDSLLTEGPAHNRCANLCPGVVTNGAVRLYASRRLRAQHLKSRDALERNRAGRSSRRLLAIGPNRPLLAEVVSRATRGIEYGVPPIKSRMTGSSPGERSCLMPLTFLAELPSLRRM